MKTWLQSRRFFIQTLAITIGVLLVLCVFFIAFLYQKSKSSTDQTIFQIESDRNAELIRKADIYFEQLIKIGASFGDLTVPYHSLISSQSLWTRELFDSMRISHASSTNFISNIDVQVLGQSFSPSIVSHEHHLGSFYYFEMYIEDNDWPYYIDLTLKDNIAFQPVTITTKGYYFSQDLFDYQATDRLEYLLTADGNIFLTNQTDSFFQKIDTLLPDIDLSEYEASEQALRTYDSYFYMVSSPDKYGFRVLSLVPQSFYTSHYITMTLQTLLMAGCLFCVAILISVFLTMRFYHPIKQTVALLQNYISDDIREYENEINYIYHNISKYISKENILPAVRQKTYSDLHNAQTAVLQYQINSHFLFNTLENIKALSITELGIDNEIETCIVMLNTIIHEGIFHKKIFVPLSEELHLAKCYLELMRLRFSDIKIQWSVDKKLLQYQVFKFSLQPILENCFAHAFENSHNRPKTIHISTLQHDHGFALIVRDNGSGINSSKLRKIKQSLDSFEATDSAKHVGIRNVHKRITDLFGHNYGIRITSDGGGTTVEIHYPLS